jgi:biotin carboxyl carrier protein
MEPAMSGTRRYAVTIGEVERSIEVRRVGVGVTGCGMQYEVCVDDGEPQLIDAARPMPDTLSLLMNRRSWEVGLVQSETGFEVDILGIRHAVDVVDPRRKALRMAARAGEEVVKTLMPGRIVRTLVAVGDMVEKGQPMIVVEAMKMENELGAPRDGKVQRICVADGDQVEAKTVLIELVEEAT